MPDIRILTEGDSSVLVEFGDTRVITTASVEAGKPKWMDKEEMPGDQPEDHCHCTAYERTAYRGSCRYDPCVLFFAG